MELELKDYFKVLMKRIWIIAPTVMVVCIAVGIYSYNLSPLYAANTKLIISQSTDDASHDALNINNLNADIQLINTYKEIIKSPSVLDKVVADHPEFKITAGQLNSKISVSSPNGSQVMTIQVQDYSQHRAADLANAVADVFKNEIPNIMKINNVTILSEAKAAAHPSPIKPNPSMNITVAFLISLILTIALSFILEYLDDTIKTEKEIERELGFPTLAAVMKIKKRDLKNKSSLSSPKVGNTQYANINS